MTMIESREDYVRHLLVDLLGEQVTALRPQQMESICEQVGQIIWGEGIEALTPQRLTSAKEFALCP